MGKPAWMTTADWNKCIYYANKYGTVPELLAAIGWHETHWGRLGAGKRGYHLGVSVYPPHYGLPQFKGLDKQLDWAAKKLGSYLDKNVNLTTVTNFAVNVWRPGNPWSWAKSVFSIYQSIGGPAKAPVTSTPSSKTTDAQISSEKEIQAITNIFTEAKNKLIDYLKQIKAIK